MTDKHVQAEAPHSNMEKDPSDWVTGDEPMTGAQKSYLKTLSEEAGAEFDESLTKAAASEQIDALQKTTGRGTSGHGDSASGSTVKKTQDAATGGGAKGATGAKAGGRDDEEVESEPEGDLFATEGKARRASR